MSLQSYSKEKLTKMSLVELSKLVLQEEKKPMKFNEVFNKAAELKGLTEEQMQGKISQFYTDLNIDGGFVSNGSNTWGLKKWTRSQKEEEIDEKPRKIVKRKKRVSEEENDDIDLELSAIDENIDEYNEDYEYDDSFDLDIDEEYDELDEEEKN